MGALATYLRSEAPALKDEVTNRKALLDDWKAAVAELIRQVRSWLAASDPEGLLTVEETTAPVREPALGVYEAPALDVSLGRRLLRVVPQARKVLATIRPTGEPERRADGLVELRDHTGEAGYYLFRSNGQWFIQGASAWLTGLAKGEVEPLTGDRFELAALSILT